MVANDERGAFSFQTRRQALQGDPDQRHCARIGFGRSRKILPGARPRHHAVPSDQDGRDQQDHQRLVAADLPGERYFQHRPLK